MEKEKNVLEVQDMSEVPEHYTGDVSCTLTHQEPYGDKMITGMIIPFQRSVR